MHKVIYGKFIGKLLAVFEDFTAAVKCDGFYVYFKDGYLKFWRGAVKRRMFLAFSRYRINRTLMWIVMRRSPLCQLHSNNRLPAIFVSSATSLVQTVSLNLLCLKASLKLTFKAIYCVCPQLTYFSKTVLLISNFIQIEFDIMTVIGYWLCSIF